MVRFVSLSLAVLIIMSAAAERSGAGPFKPGVSPADKVVVLKSLRKLLLLRDGRVLQSYRVALGRNPSGAKVAEGDGRTPEGVYRLDWRNPDSRFYRSIHVSYPNRRDLQQARKLGVSPGSDIMIHGLPNGREAIGSDHANWDWTEGCIAVTNEEMDEIWSAIENGTVIEIRP